MDVETLYNNGRYAQVLAHEKSRLILQAFVRATLEEGQHVAEERKRGPQENETNNEDIAVVVGLSALAAFLQANVTGPVLGSARQVEQLLTQLERDENSSLSLRRATTASLDVDGVSVYAYIPYIELFGLARWVFLTYLSGEPLPSRGKADDRNQVHDQDRDPAETSLVWLRLRIHAWHYRLLTEPNPGPGSVFNKMTQWSDLPSLQGQIEQCLDDIEKEVNGGPWTQQARVQFYLEKTNIHSMLGSDVKAQEALDLASKLHGFEYVLSGALGKRTRFQKESTSQLVVLAKSASDSVSGDGTEAAAVARTDTAITATTAIPQALPLNNDTLLENIDFGGANEQDTTATKGNKAAGNGEDETPARLSADDAIPAALRDVAPDNQPQLTPLDQIILLSVATLKDAFSPTDSLTQEEILPYALRVLSDTVTNWQIYSQALIVRSRIELHRSRTVERGVLQMQAMVDQVVVDTNAPESATSKVEAGSTVAADNGTATENAIPAIEITAAGEDTDHVEEPKKPTSFFPAPKQTEQAPPQVRLRYIHALSTPPKWHLEAELAFAWAGIGSLVSALEIFKGLRLWAEVALCLASSAALGDEGNSGAGGEEKAKGLLRWQLFHPSSAAAEEKEAARMADGGEEKERDVLALRAADYCGPERDPPPAGAPRLFCILGDIEAEPKHYARAWELSKHRYSRAQMSLGEHYLRGGELVKALEAYEKAVHVNRLNPQLWSRLGDISLRLNAFSKAVVAFTRAIAGANTITGGEDARTWSNLGSALYSLYTEMQNKNGQEEPARRQEEDGEEAAELFSAEEAADVASRDPASLLTQSLAAFKRGASIAHDNWRIWENVVTLASRVRPPVVGDIVVALRNILAIRHTEEAVDVAVLRLLLNEAVLPRPSPAADAALARGSQEKAVCDLIEDVLVPLITKRSELWELVTRERVWRGDLVGAVEAAEKGWRAAVSGGHSGSLGSTLAVSSRAGSDGNNGSNGRDDDARNWLENAAAWDTVVERTDELVSVLENYGPEVEGVGTRWKMKARSALRSVMGKGKERWEGSAGWTTLEGLLHGLT
ncbi:gyf domain containing protein [Niveomyces insectorum RCEF 264]|uniref:Gyf domain containing protein n=1 Tax=Niveomyces insectorum RCEF 264 TaxID=1081102 RepID=A0A167XN03_9HYPO|nr:gyf domain containing protein [Niveomyces insectorum RCEF 264]